MYTVILSSFLLFFVLPVQAIEKYHMKTAEITDGDIVFASEEDFEEVLRVGFFRIKRPDYINVMPGRDFARTFNNNPKYVNFGANGSFLGYLLSSNAQVIRFVLEREFWGTKGWDTLPENKDPNLPPAVQLMAHQMHELGVFTLRKIMHKFDLPEKLWGKATAGVVDNRGSSYLAFNLYDPSVISSHAAFDAPGQDAHTDWGYLTILDVVQEGLEAEIDGQWRPLHLEDGYFTVNFGEPLQKLLPGVNACKHRVVRQTNKVRTSIVLFLDPREGPYRDTPSEVGMVWDWDPVKRKLVNPIEATTYLSELSSQLYGQLATSEG